MINKTAFWMLLVACGAAFEMYEENHRIGIDHDGDVNYNDANYLDTGHYGPEMRDDAVQNLMLYELFNSLNRDDVPLRMHYRPKVSMMENPPASYPRMPYSDLLDLKGAIAKRPEPPVNIPANTNSDKVKTVIENEPRKGKKVRKLGTHVCYFKVCSFRRRQV